MASKSLARLKDTLPAALDLLIPPACLSCNAKLKAPVRFLCEDCAQSITLVREPFCPKCGSDISIGFCQNCLQTDFVFELSRSAVIYEGCITQVIHKFKYNGYSSLGVFLAQFLFEAVQLYPEFEDYPLVMAVPLHRVRKRERGFNQSEILAKNLAKLSGKRYISPLCRRRYTRSQTLLDHNKRLTNTAGAFKVKKSDEVLDKKIIVIDDVFTTGSTLNEISRELYKAGAQKVACLTLSRAG
nr:hypothetical protein [Candidatus Cloacimonadota bacterium]